MRCTRSAGRSWAILVVTAALFLGSWTASAATVPKGSRLLGIDVNTSQDNDFSKAFAVAKATGMQATSLVVYWDEIETAPGVFSPSPNWLWVANAYYPSQNTQVLLSVVPIDTVHRRTPADLDGLDMDDPIVIARFNALLDYVFSQIPQLQLPALSIGNEADVYLGSNTVDWAHYQKFFEATAAYARTLRPGLKVGVQVSYESAMGPLAPQVGALFAASDVLMMSYYPILLDCRVDSPSVVRSDWDALMAAYRGKPVIFAQLGYPSGSLNNSTTTKQKTFVDNVFAAWDAYASRVPLVVFIRLHDAPDSLITSWYSYYGMTDPRFGSYLKTLGLRTTAGVDKPAFTALKTQAKARGW